MTITVGSLFTGIGGIDLACEWAGMKIIWQCEIDPFCQKVLRKHWPEVKLYDDIRTITRDNAVRPDVIVGGFPCQPYSVAGKQRGAEDDRDLWPEMFRVVKELRPTWVVGENVAGFINLGLDRTLSDLESEGYTCRAFVLPALAVGAPHRRDRVFVVAYTATMGLQEQGAEQQTTRSSGSSKNVADTGGTGCEECNIAAITSEQRHGSGGSDSFGANRSTQPGMGGVLDGISARLDGHRWPAPLGQPQYEWEPPRVANGVKNRVQRLKALGNAVVPQQIFPIMKAIAKIEEQTAGEGVCLNNQQ